MNQQLIEEIEQTIAAYQEACKPEYLNYNYCDCNKLNLGICYYAKCSYFMALYEYIKIPTYIHETPLEILYQLYHENTIDIKTKILKAHQFRINYLQIILTEITNENN